MFDTINVMRAQIKGDVLRGNPPDFFTVQRIKQLRKQFEERSDYEELTKETAAIRVSKQSVTSYYPEDFFKPKNDKNES